VIRPDDEEHTFIARWNSLIRILLVEPSVKLVARTAGDHADWKWGTSCYPSNELLIRETGLGERTIRTAWGVLRGTDLAVRTRHAVAHANQSDAYSLIVPDGWEALPVLGPKTRKFTCLYCEKLINPVGNCILRKDGSVGFHVDQFVFCPKPRKVNGRDDVWCRLQWDAKQKRRGKRVWDDLGPDVWKLFRESRGDDW